MAGADVASFSTPEDIAKTVVAALQRPGSGSISPDGQWVMLFGTGGSTLLHLSASGAPAGHPIPLPGQGQWRPDSRLVMTAADPTGVVSTTLLEPSSGKTVALEMHDADFAAGRSNGRPKIVSPPYYGQWSRSSRYFAFLASVGAIGRHDSHAWRNQREEDWSERYDFPHKGLFVWDTQSGKVSLQTAVDLSVVSFDWSPDDTALVLEVENRDDRDIFGKSRTDLAIFDRTNQNLRPLVTERQSDEAEPRWSPDGKAIAFVAHGDPKIRYLGPDPSRRAPAMAVVFLDGSSQYKFPVEASAYPTMWQYAIRWSADSGRFFYNVSQDMRSVTRRADLSSRTTNPVNNPDDGLSQSTPYNKSFSTDGRRSVYTVQSAASPGGVVLAGFDRLGRPAGAVRRLLWRDNVAFEKRIRLNAVHWPSRDGRFNLQGLLLTPAAAQGMRRRQPPFPLIVSLRGGPSAVMSDFTSGQFGLEVALALRGYAVFVPDTRGRDSGSEALAYDIVNSGSIHRLPFDDAMAGVDMLVARRLADPARMGMFGHSYGGGLAAYALTHTDRFKTIVIHEGGHINLLASGEVTLSEGEKRTGAARQMPDLFGKDGRVDPAMLALRVAESPFFQTSAVRTPSLLLYGGLEGGSAASDGKPLYDMLKRGRAPTVMLVRQMAHGPDLGDQNSIAQTIDLLAGTTEWLDFWVRGIPYPDSERAALFER